MTTEKEKKRHPSERRKEKSRDAARCRRSKETEVFYELAHELPLPRTICTHLDKASIMRLTLSFLRTRKLLGSGCVKRQPKEDTQMDTLYLKSLQGFVLVVTSEGDMIFLSENVSKFIGLTQVELTGHSIFDFTHPCDHEEIRENLSVKTGAVYVRRCKELNMERDFFMRMKCTVTSRGRTVNLKSAGWKVLHCMGHLKVYTSCPPNILCSFTEPPVTCVVMLCEPIPHPSSMDMPLDSKTFMSRHSMDMKFTCCDDRVKVLVGYRPEDLVGRSAYDFYHALDSGNMTKSHQNLCAKGQVVSGHYRMLAKHGGYVWMETQATVIYNNRNSQPQGIVCINYVLSGIDEKSTIFSMDQTEELFKPHTVSEVFHQDASDTADMLFPKLKEEPEDLVQFAPTPGDTIIALDFASHQFEEPPIFYDSSSEATVSKLWKTDSPQPSSESSLAKVPSRPTPSKRNTCPMSDGAGGDYYGSRDVELKVELTERLFADGTDSPTDTQFDFSDLDLETLAPYIPMDGEDFQLNPIGQEEILAEPGQGLHTTPQYNFSNITNLFQPLDPFLSNGKDCSSSYPETALVPNYQTPASTPLPSSGGRPNLTWHTDPAIQYGRTEMNGKNGQNLACAQLQQRIYENFNQPCNEMNLGQIALGSSFKRKRQTQFSSSCSCLNIPLLDVIPRSESVDDVRKRMKAVATDNYSFSERKSSNHHRLEDTFSSGQGGVCSQFRHSQPPPDQHSSGELEQPFTEHFCSHQYQPYGILTCPKPTGVASRLLAASFDSRCLSELTQYDCDVNVPLQGALHLLHGSDLLKALDQAT
ncbi:endothelial PAS domain-containing protein 1 [Electrophorus electricus]|uniref:Endothelial PAS domain protein 1b n=1 Tax=Electrophorus electricus TaxID=8005 RepID=A0A4W4GCY2_ELEEL|nr:endothelial PAS domain-containing protein 1 [Electrophorus electricus]